MYDLLYEYISNPLGKMPYEYTASIMGDDPLKNEGGPTKK